MPPKKVVYPWDVDLVEDQEWQCGFCGRYMDDRKATRRKKAGGYTLHACVACHAILGVARIRGIEGMRRRVRELLRIEYAKHPDYRWYVNREGQQFLRVKVGLRNGEAAR